MDDYWGLESLLKKLNEFGSYLIVPYLRIDFLSKIWVSSEPFIMSWPDIPRVKMELVDFFFCFGFSLELKEKMSQLDKRFISLAMSFFLVRFMKN